jgi:hypothetical protein
MGTPELSPYVERGSIKGILRCVHNDMLVGISRKVDEYSVARFSLAMREANRDNHYSDEKPVLVSPAKRGNLKAIYSRGR